MIRIENTRFGTLEIQEGATIELPMGLVGFPDETRFALLERARGGSIAYLQSLTTPALAFPVIDGALFGNEYPNPPPNELAQAAGIEASEPIVLVVAAATPETHGLIANCLAPIIVDGGTRRGAQVVLDPRRYSASHPVTLPACDPIIQRNNQDSPTARASAA